MKILAATMALAFLAGGAIANPTMDAAATLADPTIEATALPDNRTRAASVLAVDEYVPDLGVRVTEPMPDDTAGAENYLMEGERPADEGYPAKQECDTCH